MGVFLSVSFASLHNKSNTLHPVLSIYNEFFGLMKEAQEKGLTFDSFLSVTDTNPFSRQHTEFKGMFKLLGSHEQEIPKMEEIPTKVHFTVKERYKKGEYTSIPIENYLNSNEGNWPEIEK